MSQQVILVDERDNAVGAMEKMMAHREGRLHRAFSVFIFNSAGQMLLQQRALSKYHSAGLWSNACCSHPEPGEDLHQSAERRLKEEMGFTTPLRKVFDFIYRAAFQNGLIEYEYDHVFIGTYDGPIKVNSKEAIDYTFKSMDEISHSLYTSPEQYTEWFRIAFPRVVAGEGY